MNKKASLKRKIWFLLIVIGLIWLWQTGYLSSEMIGWKAKDTITGHTTADQVYDSNFGAIELHFCPAENCSSYMYSTLSSAEESIHCALFDLNLPEIIAVLTEKNDEIDVKLVVDDNHYEELADLDFVRQDTSSQYSHNKFCIVDDEIVTTGSMNPTYNGNYKNNNNLVIVESSILAENYEDEFSELWSGEFGDGKRTEDPIVVLDGTIVKNYFCPEDWCANKIIDELSLANESIHFLTFSFTSEPIARKLIELHDANITVTGVFEKQQNSKYSKYAELLDAGLNVRWDTNKYKMHHKVFIIDSKIVVTGSMNPSKSGDTRNDENLLIIYDEEIASLFLKEFEKV